MSFPPAWALMVFVPTFCPLDVRDLLLWVIRLRVVLGRASMPAVTRTSDSTDGSSKRLLLGPKGLELLLLAKSGDTVLLGITNYLAPIVSAAFLGESQTHVLSPCCLSSITERIGDPHPR